MEMAETVESLSGSGCKIESGRGREVEEERYCCLVEKGRGHRPTLIRI